MVAETHRPRANAHPPRRAAARCNARAQRGSALITALFTLIVAAAIAATLSQLLTSGAQSGALDLLESRARLAAQSGLEWARYRITRGGACPPPNLTLREDALAGFTVQLGCTRTDHVIGTTTRSVYAIDAFAQRGRFGDVDYVSARLTENVVR